MQTINEVLRLGNTGEGGRTFNLLSSPDQELKDDHTTPPIDDFTTSFSSWSIKDLGEYTQARYRERITQEKGLYNPNTISVIDERTTKDRTIKLGGFTSDTKEVPEDPDYVTQEWQSVRIRFEDIATSVGCAILKSFLFFGPESVGLVDESGVWYQPV